MDTTRRWGRDAEAGIGGVERTRENDERRPMRDQEEEEMMNHALLWVRLLAVLALAAVPIALGRGVPAMAARGDLVAEVITPEDGVRGISPSIAFDGNYLYYTEYAGFTLHRIDVPPAGGPSIATGHVDVPITGADSGIMALSYDARRDRFWAVGGDGLSVYLLNKAGTASLAYQIDPVTDRPGFQTGPFVIETKIAYDGTDDTIWYSPDATSRIYHYRTVADVLGTAVLVAATPYIDVDMAPNDMVAQCGYNQSSGVAVGGAHLFITVAGCPYYFEYTKTGVKVAAHPYFPMMSSSQDAECDNVSYGVAVLWIKEAYQGRIVAVEQPSAGACVFGGGM
jgi:hypothetical protein